LEAKRYPNSCAASERVCREFNNAKNAVEDEIRQGMRETDKKRALTTQELARDSDADGRKIPNMF
jgi:predicted transcriptional regulator